MKTSKITSAALLLSVAMIGSAVAQGAAGISGNATGRAGTGGAPAAGAGVSVGGGAMSGGGAANSARPSASAPVAAGQGRGAMTSGITADRGPRVAQENGNWRGGERRWNRGPRGPAVGFGIGFGAPYYYGDSYAYYNEPYYSGGTTYYSEPSGDDDAYCSQRYRSYDPASGTYLGYDGRRHPCP